VIIGICIIRKPALGNTWGVIANPIKTPMGTNGHLDLDTGGKSIDQKVYQSMIGSLLYLRASRPDIMLSVCMCARFQVDPKEVHLRAMKRIMRYLVYTPKFGLWYPKGSTFDLIGEREIGSNLFQNDFGG
jgi:hypothetical protein